MKENSLTTETNKRTKRARQEEEDAQVGESAATVEAKAGDGGSDEEGLDERMLTALRAASDRKALNIVALDLRQIASFTDFFLIASGTNVRQVQAVADAVVEKLKEIGKRPARIEGYKSAEWVLLDYGDFIFHIFDEKSRRFFDLDRLWRDATPVLLPADIAAAGGVAEADSLRNVQ